MHCFYVVSLPIFLSHPNHTRADVFNDVRFTCSAVGYGIVTLMWKRMGILRVPITAVQVNSTLHDVVDSTLHIKRVNGYYAGEYYCIAENSAGQVKSKIASLLVQGMICVHVVCVCAAVMHVCVFVSIYYNVFV